MGGGFSRIVTVCCVDLVMWCWDFEKTEQCLGFICFSVQNLNLDV